MLPFGITAIEFALVTFISAFLGVVLVMGASKFVRTVYLAAFAVGVYLWFFTDTLGDANFLGVNAGFVYDPETMGLLGLFVATLLVFFASDRNLTGQRGVAGRTGLALAATAALALGLHGFGEGADFGFTAAQTPANDILGAFGGYTASLSWVLHKMLEPTIAAACYVGLSERAAGPTKFHFTDAGVLAMIFVIPPVIGSVVGYFLTFDHTYAFAVGLGASVYALAKVGRLLYSGPGEDSSWASLKVGLAAAAGLLCIFLAALLH